MRFQRAAFIYNPVSGSRTPDRKIREIRGLLEASAGEVRLAPTRGPHHSSELAREAVADGCDLVAALGGDGTTNEIVQGLAGTDRPALLVLPGGTANVMVREVGLPTDPVAAAALLPRLEEQAIRLGVVEFDEGDSRYFVLMFGAGLDAAIAARTLPGLKRRLGTAAFWVSGAQQAVHRLPRLKVAMGSGTVGDDASSLVVVSKSRRYGGGLVCTPSANLLSSNFEVAHFAGTSRTRYCGYLLAATCEITSRWPGIRHARTTHLRLEACAGEQVQFQVDGEVAGTLPARVSLSPLSVTVLLPPAYQLAAGSNGPGDLLAPPNPT